MDHTHRPRQRPRDALKDAEPGSWPSTVGGAPLTTARVHGSQDSKPRGHGPKTLPRDYVPNLPHSWTPVPSYFAGKWSG